VHCSGSTFGVTIIAKVLHLLLKSLLVVVILITSCLGWLRWDSHQPRDAWFVERQGKIRSVLTQQSTLRDAQLSEAVRLLSTSGLQVSFRVIRNVQTDTPKPLLIVLGGHRTGDDSVDLFGDVNDYAVVGIKYPYDGPDRVAGLLPVARAMPLARQAVLDTVPAISLVIDWLQDQEWADKRRIVVVGASLGVPFATVAAARDRRIGGVMLIHGAADTRLWLEHQVSRRIDRRILHYPLASVLFWLAYGPIFDTQEHLDDLSPRPLLIVAARQDERTPPGQAALLFRLAGEPKRLRYTEGRHIQPGRKEIVGDLLAIANEEFDFLTNAAR